MAKRSFFGEAADPKTRQCEWCDRQALEVYEIHKPRKAVGTGLFLYTCGRHRALAREAARTPEGPKAA